MRASRGVLRARLRRGRWPLPTPQDAGPRLDPPLLPNSLLLPFLQHTLLPNRPPLATYSYWCGIHVWCYCASFFSISNRDGVLSISFHAENCEWLPAKSCCCIPRTQPALPALGSIFSPLQSVHAVSPSQLIHQMYGGINLLCRDNTSAAISGRYNLDARWSTLDKKGQEDHEDLVVSPWDRSPYSQGCPLSSTLEPFPQLVL